MHRALIKHITVIFLMILNLNLSVHSKQLEHTGELYLASATQMQDIDNLLNKAKTNNKLALIIMGADWCHDSRSLATKLYLPEVKNIIDTHYELLFVDVGYLTKIEKVITRFNMPVIYATPPVLIIDPETEQRLNGHNMHIWRDADLVSVEDTVKYFTDMANQSRASYLPLNLKPDEQEKLSQLNQMINEFEKAQSKRIYKAFTIIGPLIKEKKEGGKAKHFAKHWKAVASLRYKITDDLALLREQAINISRKNTGEALVFPQYPAFEWEK